MIFRAQAVEEALRKDRDCPVEKETPKRRGASGREEAQPSPSFPLFFILSVFIKSLPANPSPKRQNTKNMDRKQDAQEQARQRET